MTLSKKEIIIQKSADLFHEFGYTNTGINTILKVLEIPKGSFYNFFESKEDLLIHVIRFQLERSKNIFEMATKENYNIEGIKLFFNSFFEMFESMDYKNGCPIGNMILELSDNSEKIRNELQTWTSFMETEICKILEHEKFVYLMDNKSLASFIVATFEGVILKSKLEKNADALEQFKTIILENILTKK